MGDVESGPSHQCAPVAVRAGGLGVVERQNRSSSLGRDFVVC